jgi:hypothetical protein
MPRVKTLGFFVVWSLSGCVLSRWNQGGATSSFSAVHGLTDASSRHRLGCELPQVIIQVDLQELAPLDGPHLPE